MDGTVLVADDDRTIRTVLTQALTRAGCRVHATSSLATLMRWVGEGKGDLVISDVMMPDGNGIEQLPKITAMRPGLPVIIISAQNTMTTAIKATEADAFDYLPKPFDLPDLMKRAARALATKRRIAPVQSAPVVKEDLPLVGRTAAMQSLYQLIAKVMNAPMPVMISGESGTGKSLIARCIHMLSDRRAKPFVIQTQADLEREHGLDAAILQAQGGTIVLDELRDLDLGMQAKIARSLDHLREDAPRIIATTQSDPQELMDPKMFREDLFYRLSAVTLTVPPLRQRVDDIALLTQHFLDQQREGGGAMLSLDPDAAAIMQTFTWPGNVRQLENAISRLAFTASSDIVTGAEVTAALGAAAPTVRQNMNETDRLADSVAAHVQRYFDLHGGDLPPAGLYGRILKEIEAPLLEIALSATGGNQAKCADLLGINRNTLRKKLSELDIHVTRHRKLM